MDKNIGYLDKGIRFFLGTVLGYVGYTREPRSGLNVLLLLTAAYLFLSALSGVCAFYSAFGLNTREKE